MLRYKISERARKKFIENCIQFDTPRLNSEKYPEDVPVEADIDYDGRHKLDYYLPSSDEAYILIHGGAFVYGDKGLDKCFGMHLARRSGIMVANIDYTLMPETGLRGQTEQIFSAISFIMKDKNVKTVHTIGDSAGGYLALLTGILLHSEKARDRFGLKVSDLPAVGSINMICGAFRASPKTFAGIYFDPDKNLPDFIYDLTTAMEPGGFPPLVLTTGDKDSLLRENRILKAKLENMNIPFSYREFTSAEDRVMHHVFSIAHPTWPESIESIDMFIHR